MEEERRQQEDRHDVVAENEAKGAQVSGLKRFPLLPIRGTVLFPGLAQPLHIGRPRSLEALRVALQDREKLVIATQKDERIEDPGPQDLYPTATLAAVIAQRTSGGDAVNAVVQGEERVRIDRILDMGKYYVAEVEPLEEHLPGTDDLDFLALHRELKDLSIKVLDAAAGRVPDNIRSLIQNADPSYLTDLAIAHLDKSVAEKIELLEMLDVKERMRKMIEILQTELKIIELRREMQAKFEERLNQQQKEAYLRMQIDTIQKELGEDGDTKGEIEELRKAVEEAGMPEEVRKIAEEELKRLSRISRQSPEYVVSRNYLDWLVALPWSKTSEDHLDLERAARILDEDHTGLEKVKNRILEYLAVCKLRNDLRGPILCLVGPPGVGKTSLGKSIARVLGRKFVRIALGGVRDEAEIRGHRRTYIGAMPGRIIEAMKKAGTKNPVILLDEVDKLGRHFMGDPAAALLEVLDPEQNHTFTDHYIAAPFDLSQVLFICTANARDEIPLPLLDRMEVIELSGYTQEEKIAIAENHLIPEQIAEHGLRPEQITFTREALAEIIRHHTREAGVRDLKRKIAKVCRCVAREIIEKSVERITVDPARIHTYLGAPRYFSEVAERTAVPGVATGLAWTPVGGDILFVEVTLMEGKGNFTLTGQLGDVMKESAQAAYSYIRTHAQKLGIPLEYFTKRDLHIHVPAGATPKDGPSAGVTMLTAMVSAFTGRRVRDDVAMTGEITLRGLVLPVGGIKEKVLAAHRAGIKEVILPEQNAKDLADLPREVKESMKFHLVKRMHEVLRIALDLDFEEAQLPLLPPVDSQATQMPTNSLC